MYYTFRRVSYQSTISRIDFKCHRNQPAHAACAAKNSQKKEENALVARHVITKRVTFVTGHSSQAKE